jgi:hypothetical protein
MDADRIRDRKLLTVLLSMIPTPGVKISGPLFRMTPQAVIEVDTKTVPDDEIFTVRYPNSAEEQILGLEEIRSDAAARLRDLPDPAQIDMFIDTTNPNSET